MRELRLAVIADDLTGALDASAPFAGEGAPVCVAACPEAFPQALANGGQVVALSTRSREIPAAEAARRVAEALALLPFGMRVLKKVDSRLKGNIASELAAFGDARFVFLPAVPEFGRVIQDGKVQGFGVDTPIDVRSALGNAASRSTIPDTATHADMLNAVAAAPPDAVLVGARGVSVALAEASGVTATPPCFPLPLPAVFAVGSTDPITLMQVDTLCADKPDTIHIHAPSGDLPIPTGPLGPVTVLQTTDGPEAAAARVAARFSETARPYLAEAHAMLLTGGATAEAILASMGVMLLSLEGDILPGLPLCRAGDKVIVTKSGGFGQKTTFLKILDGPPRLD